MHQFRHSPALESMLSFATWQQRFNEHDKAALKDALGTIRTAMVQPFGANADAKRRNSHCITDTEFDRAVMTVLACSMVMWLSGELDTVQCVGDAE